MSGDENFTLYKFYENGGMKGYYTKKEEKNIEMKILILVIKETVVGNNSYFLF